MYPFKTIKHWSEADQPREKFLSNNKSHLSNAELIAILIGSGSKEESAVHLAERMLYSVDDDLQKLANLSIQELSRFKGIGLAKAISIAAAVELCYNRMVNNPMQKTYKAGKTPDNYQWIQEILQPEEQGRWILLFNSSGHLQHKEKIETEDETYGDPRALLQITIESECGSFILVHKTTTPEQQTTSDELKYILQLKQVANMLSLTILDQLTIHPEGYNSYREQGLLN